MKDIVIYSLPTCPNCRHLKMLLEKEGISFAYRTFDPESDDDVAEMSYMGIYDAQFPVVYIDGQRLPAMTVAEYMNAIRA